jgi:catechol 2,3-dioxygenase-like lactoylglutathione lyase family enzyme
MKFLILPAMLSAATLLAQDLYRDPGIGKIVQIAIVCKDIDACAARWSRLLGQPAPPPRTTVPGREAKVVYRGRPSDGQVRLTFFKTGDAVLELMQPVGPDTHWKEHLDKHGEGVHHIAFKVENLEKSLDSLEKQGMPLLHRGRFDTDNGTYAYVDSLDKLGVTVELLHWDAPAR